MVTCFQTGRHIAGDMVGPGRPLHRVAGPRLAWCIADEAGVALLQADHARQICRREPYLASLHPIESADGGASWQLVAEAQLSSASNSGWLQARLSGDLYGIAVLDGAPPGFVRSETLFVNEWLQIPPSKGFRADPFFWPSRPGLLLCETYAHSTGRGHLEAITLKNADRRSRTGFTGVGVPSFLPVRLDE